MIPSKETWQALNSATVPTNGKRKQSAQLTNADKLVYLYAMNVAGTSNLFYAEPCVVAPATGLAVDTVKNCKRRLQKAGLLVPTGRYRNRRGVWEYEVMRAENVVAIPAAETAVATVEKCASATREGAPATPGGVRQRYPLSEGLMSSKGGGRTPRVSKNSINPDSIESAIKERIRRGVFRKRHDPDEVACKFWDHHGRRIKTFDQAKRLADSWIAKTWSDGAEYEREMEQKNERLMARFRNDDQLCKMTPDELQWLVDYGSISDGQKASAMAERESRRTDVAMKEKSRRARDVLKGGRGQSATGDEFTRADVEFLCGDPDASGLTIDELVRLRGLVEERNRRPTEQELNDLTAQFPGVTPAD